MKILDCASKLKDLYVERSELEINLERVKSELYKRELLLTPDDGWQGKNQEMRDLEKSKTLLLDESWNNLNNAKTETEEAMTLNEGVIEALEAERRGYEWEIRANLVTVMAGKLQASVQPETTAFDDVMDNAVDDDIFIPSDEIADVELSIQEEAPF